MSLSDSKPCDQVKSATKTKMTLEERKEAKIHSQKKYRIKMKAFQQTNEFDLEDSTQDQNTRPGFHLKQGRISDEALELYRELRQNQKELDRANLVINQDVPATIDWIIRNHTEDLFNALKRHGLIPNNRIDQRDTKEELPEPKSPGSPLTPFIFGDFPEPPKFLSRFSLI